MKIETEDFRALMTNDEAYQEKNTPFAIWETTDCLMVDSGMS
jgi:hypothetical protein